jgi:hypothetical protein
MLFTHIKLRAIVYFLQMDVVQCRRVERWMVERRAQRNFFFFFLWLTFGARTFVSRATPPSIDASIAYIIVVVARCSFDID